MNDDQFQDNFGVQGGSPEPIGGDGALGEAPQQTIDDNNSLADDPFITQDPQNSGTFEINADADAPVSEEVVPENVPEDTSNLDPEMTRKMDELLGNDIESPVEPFSEPVSPVQPVQPVAEQPVEVAQPVDVAQPVEAAQPVDVAQPVEAAQPVQLVDVVQPVEALPVQPEPAMPVQSEPVQPVAEQPVPQPQMAESVPERPVSELGSTAPSNIEQAAATQSVSDASKKKNNKNLLVIFAIGLVLLLATGCVIAFVMLNSPKKPTSGNNGGDTENVVPDEPEENETTSQRVGTPSHGYVDIPKDWVRLINESTEISGTGYADGENESIVAFDSTEVTETMTANTLAQSLLSDATNAGMSLPQLATVKVSKYDGYQVFYYNAKTEKWVFKYVFEAEDKRVHNLQIVVKDNTSELLTTVPASWSLNQNSSNTETKKNEAKTETETESKSKSSAAAAAEE